MVNSAFCDFCFRSSDGKAHFLAGIEQEVPAGNNSTEDSLTCSPDRTMFKLTFLSEVEQEQQHERIADCIRTWGSMDLPFQGASNTIPMRFSMLPHCRGGTLRSCFITMFYCTIQLATACRLVIVLYCRLRMKVACKVAETKELYTAR